MAAYKWPFAGRFRRGAFGWKGTGIDLQLGVILAPDHLARMGRYFQTKSPIHSASDQRR